MSTTCAENSPQYLPKIEEIRGTRRLSIFLRFPVLVYSILIRSFYPKTFARLLIGGKMASASTNTDRRRAQLLGFAHLFLGILLMCMLFKVWPQFPWPSAENKLPTLLPIKFWVWQLWTTLDERLILLVIVAGGLGSFVHASTSFADYVGNDRFDRTWTWWYLLRPFIGMSLALLLRKAWDG